MNTPKLPTMPKPDTHCFDEDTGKDVWSHSPEQMQAYALAAIEALRAQLGQGVPHDAGQQINQLVSAAFRKGELWERCQGKGWPEAESDEFTKLRDETIPDAIAQLQRALASAPPAPKQKPMTEYERAVMYAALSCVELQEKDPATMFKMIVEGVERFHHIGEKK